MMAVVEGRRRNRLNRWNPVVRGRTGSGAAIVVVVVGAAAIATPHVDTPEPGSRIATRPEGELLLDGRQFEDVGEADLHEPGTPAIRTRHCSHPFFPFRLDPPGLVSAESACGLNPRLSGPGRGRSS